MGSTQSNLSSQHVFQSGHGKLGFNLMNSLQQNPESDATRELETSLTIQKKVTKELERLQSKEDGFSRLIDEQIHTTQDDKPDRNTISRSIATLSQKLHSRPASINVEEETRRAEMAVIRCLRLNDRRPLDCWKEVEDFKQEITRLENSFVQKVVGDV